MRIAIPPNLSSSESLPLWPPVLAVRGPGARTSLHAHHALHIVLATEGMLRIRTSVRTPWCALPGIVSAADVMHEIDACGVDTLLVFLDPESGAGASLSADVDGPYRGIDARERDLLVRSAPSPNAIMGPDGDTWSTLAVATLSKGSRPPPRRVHPRVRRLLSLLHTGTCGEAKHKNNLEELAALVHLSPGRLMHAFSESIGIPLRPYLAWLRLQRACAGVAGGEPLARVAADTGFSDAAHMSRTFRTMLGAPPSALRSATR